MGKAIQNLVFFKVGSIACIALAAIGRPGLAALVAAGLVALHLTRNVARVKEGLLIAAAVVIGFSWESLMVATGLIQYSAAAAGTMIAPLWIVAMWALFATTINHGLRKLKHNWIYAAAFGLIGGPLAFFGGVSAGAAQFNNMPLALAAIGVGWAFILPALCLIADSIIDSPYLEPQPRTALQRAPEGLLTALSSVGQK